MRVSVPRYTRPDLRLRLDMNTEKVKVLRIGGDHSSIEQSTNFDGAPAQPSFLKRRIRKDGREQGGSTSLAGTLRFVGGGTYALQGTIGSFSIDRRKKTKIGKNLKI